jgi:predicted RNA-binding protein YlqC (UPF0109 family)
MKDLIEYIAKQLVDKPDEVSVTEKKIDEETMELILKVNKNDVGKVIGKKGNTANSMRILLAAVGGKAHQKVALKIFDYPEEDGK